ncbi:hypothetical protein D2Q93_01300 [Alicyclobacillaceae bacterium I2511]|nr:hypothetical protein D2Q93_01300 [Alicyclobacillaceae bacterium I2511]
MPPCGEFTRAIWRTLAAQLILLVLQFLLGMVVNLWVVIPAIHPGAHPANYFAGLAQGIVWALVYGNAFLQLHIAVGIVLWLLSLLLIAWAILIRARVLILAAILAWMGLTSAAFNGGSFLNEGGMAFNSLLMAVGMVLAACSYGWAWGSRIGINAHGRGL